MYNFVFTKGYLYLSTQFSPPALHLSPFSVFFSLVFNSKKKITTITTTFDIVQILCITSSFFYIYIYIYHK